jgi:GH25 family lysozyme M1 (1,4-beta-N-acetylmuramidase)
VPGTDISGRTRVPSWAQVASGNSFVAVETRQGITPSLVNPHYAAQVTAASAAGLYVMPYVFADPAKATGAAEFADAWSVMSGVTDPTYDTGGTYLPLALDLEWDQVNFPGQECYGLSTSAMVSWIAAFVSAAQDKGVTPVIYTGQDWWDDCTGGSDQFSAEPLWLASYNPVPAMPTGWNDYTFWQSSDMATISGISGQADVDQLQSAPTLVTIDAGASFSLQVQSLNLLAGQAVTSYTATGLPPGLQISPSGLISGQLTSGATGSYQVRVASSGPAVVPDSVSITMDVYAPLTVTPPAGVTTTAGAPVSVQVQSSDENLGAPGYTPPVFRASGLPAGTSISPTGLVSGWPAAAGAHRVTVSAMDGLHATASASFTWTVRAASDNGTTGAIRQQGGSGKCLSDPSGKTATGTAVDLETCTRKPNQAWTAVQDGTIRVLGHCLAATGSRVVLYRCDNSIADQWRAGTDGALVSARYATCLNVPSIAAPNGTAPTLASCDGSPTKASQHWSRPAAPVVSGVGASCLGAAGPTAELSNCGNYSTQHWLMASNAQVVVHSSDCLTANGMAVMVAKCDNVASQHWQLVTAGVIADEIRSTASGLCVTVPSATSAAGAPLVLGPCSAAPTSTWRVG